MHDTTILDIYDMLERGEIGIGLYNMLVNAYRENPDVIR